MEEDKNPNEATQETTSLEPDAQGQPAEPNQAAQPEAAEASPEDAIGQDGRPIASIDPGAAADKPSKGPGGIKAFFQRANLYILLFVALVLVGAAVAIVSYLDSKKQPATPAIATQNLTQSQLRQLANSNASVGGSGKTLTIQGSAVVAGQELVKGDLAAAGNLKVGGSITAQDITVRNITASGSLKVASINTSNITASGSINLGPTQTQKLQVADSLIVKGDVTMQNDLNVAGSSTFNGTITAHQINASKIVLSGNSELQVPGHISFPGATPIRTAVNHNMLGGAGNVSISGSDTAGTINVSTGSGTQAGCFVTLKFRKAYAGQPHVLLTPANHGVGQMDYYAKTTTTQMRLCSGNAPPANSSFSFTYLVFS